MHVAHETVYQLLYIQRRGELRRELAAALRTGRARRRPHREAACWQPRFAAPMVVISERPAEVEGRAVPGHWEGDLIIGKDGASAIGTLVERATRYVMLLHLPNGRAAEHGRDALVETVQTLPGHVVRSLTWDQGAEMAPTPPAPLPQVSRSTSATRPAPGSAARTRTRTACCGSTSQGHRPLGPQSRAPDRRRRRTQRPPTQKARLGNPSRAPA